MLNSFSEFCLSSVKNAYRVSSNISWDAYFLLYIVDPGCLNKSDLALCILHSIPPLIFEDGVKYSNRE